MKIIILGNQARSMSIFWRVLIKRLVADGHEILCLAPPGDVDSENSLRSFGAEVINYPLNRKGLNPFQDLKSYLALKKIFFSEKPDLIFTSTIKPVIYGLLAAHKAKVPATFATITGLGYTFEKDSFFKRIINIISEKLYKTALAKAQGVFFQNKDDEKLFMERGILADKAKVRLARGTGVDTNHFKKEALPRIKNNGALTFLFIGRLLEAKGLFEYEKAAGILRKKWPRARFQILGPMEEGPGSITKEQMQKWMSAGNVEYLGSSGDVRPYIKNAHVIVLPSWREGTPTAIMESMSMGRPCVVSQAPGCEEVVKDGENGFLCKVRDPESLASNMEKFLINPDLLAPMGEKSRDMAVSIFDADKVAEGIIKDMRALSPAGLWRNKEN